MKWIAWKYTALMWAIASALTLLSTLVAQGQIEVPKEADPHKLISARLTAVLPEGAYLSDGGWEVNGVTSKQAADFRVLEMELLWTGTPGDYWIVFDGVMLKNVTFKDGDGKSVTIPCYLGRIKGRAPCKIRGSAPGPDPPLPPDPPGPGDKYRIVMFYSSDPAALSRLPSGQRDVLNSQSFRDYLVSEGHVLLEVLDPSRFSGSVPEKWKPWVDSILGDPLPRLAIAPKDTSGYVADYPLPNGIDAAKAFLKAPQRARDVKLPEEAKR